MKINETIQKEMRFIVPSLVMGLIFTLIFCTKAYSMKMADDLSKSFIRLHVIANSDLEYDQALKLKVRDSVLSSISAEVERAASIEETRAYINRNIGRIKEVAEKTIRDEGYSYPADVSLTTSLFPTKYYGDIALVEGEYEALRIKIGGATGQNWWCVVYPPLCYVDVAKGEISYDASRRLKNDLPDKQYEFVKREDKPSYKIKFKIVEMWQGGRYAFHK